MKNLFLYISFFLALGLVITGCETEVEKANAEYDWEAVIPGPQEIKINGGPTVFTGPEYEFVALYRGGSTYEWTKISGDYEISESNEFKTVVTSSATEDGEGVISVTETTYGGIVGEPDTLTFSISLFCELDINTFVGEYSCDEAGYGVYGVNFSLGEEENSIVNDNFWDYPAEGETVIYYLSGDFDQVVTVPEQAFKFGDGSDGSVSGSGTYDACTGIMTVSYNVVYDGGDNPTEHVFTPGAPAKKSVFKKKGE